MDPVCKKIKSALKKRIPIHSFRMWIEPLKLSCNEDTDWVVHCPNFFSKKRVQDLFAAMLQSEIQQVVGRQCRLSFAISNNGDNPVSDQIDHPQLPLPNHNMHPSNGCFLRKDFTFDRFVVGGNNDFAYSASLALACGRSSQQNALFLLA